MKYYIFKYGQHSALQMFIDKSFYPIRRDLYNEQVLTEFLKEQHQNTIIYITKYPHNRLVDCLILELFDINEVKALKEKLEDMGHNVVIVSAGKNIYDLYCEIYPTQFTTNRQFRDYVIAFFDLLDDEKSRYRSLNIKDIGKGLKGKVPMIGSYNYEAKQDVKIIDGAFASKKQKMTGHQRKIEKQIIKTDS